MPCTVKAQVVWLLDVPDDDFAIERVEANEAASI
jgi:hypothetical protein